MLNTFSWEFITLETISIKSYRKMKTEFWRNKYPSLVRITALLWLTDRLGPYAVRTSCVNHFTNHNVGSIVNSYAEYIPMALRNTLGIIRTSSHSRNHGSLNHYGTPDNILKSFIKKNSIHLEYLLIYFITRD